MINLNLFALVLMFFLNCEEAGTLPSCGDSAKVVSECTDRTGTVQFDQKQRDLLS
jgi:hypothetical protein